MKVFYKKGWGIALSLLLIFTLLPISGEVNAETVCKATARAILGACQLKASTEYWTTQAACINYRDEDEKAECEEGANEALSSALEDCSDQYDARIRACDFLNEDAYDPEIDPENFSPDITNPYFPLEPGTVYVYRGVDEEGEPFEDRVEVLDETTEIGGVECRVVRDVVSQDDEVLEETYDFYAQDSAGNVWYFGEDSREYEGGWISSIAGAWYTGIKGARPGIIMKADPRPGAIYRQEYHPGNAEDMAYVVSKGESVEVPQGSYSDCVKTIDWSPFEPDIIEYKYYAPGIGFIKSVANTGETVELVSIERGGGE